MASPRPLPRIVLGLLGAVLAAACASPGLSVPEAPAAPAVRVGIPRGVPAVRGEVRADDLRAAFERLGWERPLSVHEPERLWLLARLAPAWSRGHALRGRLARLPAGDLGDALRALLAEDPEAALASLSARPAGPERWSDLAAGTLAAAVGDEDGALRAATRALASPRDFVRQEAWMLRGRLLLARGKLESVEACAQEAAAIDPRDARPARLRADALKAAGRIDDAALALLEALRIAPESAAYAHRLADTLRLGAEPATWARVAASLPAAVGTRPHAELLALRALVAEHAGDPAGAEALYRSALAAGAVPVPLDRDLRRLLARRGAWQEAYGLLLRAIPPGVLDDPHNLLRGRWVALRRAVAAAPSPAAPAAARLELGRALVGVGALDEAVAVLATAPGPQADALGRRVQAHLDLEQGLREWIEAGYNAAKRHEEPPSFEAGLRVLRTLARRHLPPDERAAFEHPELGLRELPLLGSWLDHGTDTTNPVVAHFRRYGRFLLFGRQGDVPVEAIVLSLASLSRAHPITTVGVTYHHDIAIGYDRALRSNIAARGGMLGGACLADGIWIDADTARHNDFELRRALALDPGAVEAARALAPLAADGPGGVFALTDTGGAGLRLAARYAAREPAGTWGSYGTLTAHEFGHVADIRRHLPVLARLPATLALLVRNGLDVDRVQMELEMRAQLGACVDAPDPDLALAEMLLALPVVQREPEVHDGGYRDGLRAMLRHIHARPDLYPRIDRSRRLVTQLDRLDNEQIRRAARAALGG